MKRRHSMPFGAETSATGTRFRLWAPDARRVSLKGGPDAACASFEATLERTQNGWHELTVPELGAGSRYRYRIDDEIDVPDPASRYNPDGVHGPGEIVDPSSFDWPEDGWRGRPWREAVVYELHLGTFTREGTYAAAAQHLPQLAELGVTAIELLPVASFPGRRGWGYDGVLLYAPHPSYGRPEDLKRFVVEAHRAGLMVLLDVVYNHFGPDGNYLGRYARPFFSSRHKTAWGDAIDFGQQTVRQFFIHNACYWLEEYRFDGLRIDAVHAMHDDSTPHFIAELTETVRSGPGSERLVHIVLENHHNEARFLGQRERSVVSQWNDDSHHPLHVLLTGERDGYYVDYSDRPLEHLGRVLSEGFAYQGERSQFSGEPRGERSRELPPACFVNFIQNHDQIGNRARGERLTELAPPDALRAAFALLLLSPQIPMIFMGEEYAARQPFLYFCDFEGPLADAVREGRRNEFAAFAAFADEAERAKIPDPNAQRTFEASKLDLDERTRGPHAKWLEYTRELLALRRRHVVPLMDEVIPGESSFEVREHLLSVRWPARDGTALLMRANLGDRPVPTEPASGELLYSTAGSQAIEATLGAWEVRLHRTRA